MGFPETDEKIEVLQGSDVTLPYIFLGAGLSGSTDPAQAVPVDFTGCTARMQVRVSPDSGATLLLSLAGGAGVSGGSPSGIAFFAGTSVPGPPVPAYNDGFTITITKAQSLAMNGGRAGVFYYDLFIDWPSGVSTIYMRGTFQLTSTATR